MWSPDGQQIAFTSERSGNRDIWVMSVDGDEPRQLINHPSEDFYPVWSPDGQWLVFTTSRDGSRRLWRVPVAGGAPEPLDIGEGNYVRWSPDGQHLVFAGAGEERSGNVWRWSAAEGNESLITDLAGRVGSLGPHLATDGEFLYFQWREDLGDIWVMDILTDANE
jgi:TolB protein